MQATQANRGRALEELVEMVFGSAGPHVKMFRQSNKWVPLRSGRAFPSKGAPVDFVGAINGVPIAVECKESTNGKLSLGKSRFPQKEIDALSDFTRAGGRAFVVAAFWQDNILAIYPFAEFYEMWLNYKNRERLSYVTAKDAAAVIPIGDARRLPVLLGEPKVAPQAIIYCFSPNRMV